MATFLHITDPHLRPPGELLKGRIDTDRLTVRAIEAVIARHDDLDAVIVTGDITDLGEEEAYQRADMLLSRFSVPVFVVPGNHDRMGPMREAFRAFPGVGDAPVEDKICYARTIAGVKLVMLDTAVDGLDRREHHGEFGTAQLAFLDEALADGTPALIGMHHPPFTVGVAFMDRIGVRDSAAFASVLARHDNAKAIVCGHVHRVIVGTVGRVPAIAIPGVAHQIALPLGEEEKPRAVMEPSTYALHHIGPDEAVSQILYVEDFGEPPQPAASR